jgi:nicotinate-nucleotide pyrophosphorylase (carboxylating)
VRPAPIAIETVRKVVAAALEEDLGESGDITTLAIVAPERRANGYLVGRSALVVAGLLVAREVFRHLDPDAAFEECRSDGEETAAGTRLAVVTGSARAILAGERTALNFLMRMSGVATASRAAVAEVEGTGAVILDTRKTVPGWRALDKYSVAVGGATNHRIGLFDAVLIKDTHLSTGVSITEAVGRARAAGHAPRSITVEVGTPGELDEAIRAGAGRALLDNMDLATLRRCVASAAGRIVLEASGGLRPGRLREVAETGVRYLSLGYLTHSVRAPDIAMDLEVLP